MRRLLLAALALWLPACGWAQAELKPGAANVTFDDALNASLAAAWRARPDGYKPRTRHLLPDGRPRYTNRLFLETSPYLLQHAHNPVNWRPWGGEAFAEAERTGRPVLLSVGYSTCHWCHVMEEESFEDEEIARYINDNYIAIKVDREERPDIDSVYMSAVTALTGRGGWPMNVWLTAERKPFYGGTYFPARDGDRGVATGFLTLLQKMRGVHAERPETVAHNAKLFVEMAAQNLAPPGGDGLPTVEVLDRVAALYREDFDPENGGLHGAPKFPSGLSIRLLLRYARRSGDAVFREMAATTLERMAAGGIHDQIGGGFHRYSTDAEWLVPHFEKMLYDNALLAVAYLEGYQATGREEFAEAARATLAYLARDMSAPEGGFYSATDADSLTPQGHREEGWYFTWTPGEITAAVGAEAAPKWIEYFGVSAGGNFEGRNILHVAKPGARPAEEAYATGRERLYQRRSQRPAPLRDDKILAAWNGLAISAFARAALVLGDPEYAARAEQAAGFVLGHMRRDGRLLRSYRAGAARHAGYLDDYAFVTAGLLDLFEATGETRWLSEAIALDGVLARHYEDPAGGGFFRTADDQEALLAREKPAYDGAEPAGNSVQVLNLLRLHEFTTADGYRKRAENALRALEGVLARAPSALSELLLAVDFWLDAPRQVLIVTPTNRGEAAPFLEAMRRIDLPNRIVAVAAEGDDLAQKAAIIPLFEDKRAIGGRPTAYVCEERVCKLPTADLDVFRRQLQEVTPYPER